MADRRPVVSRRAFLNSSLLGGAAAALRGGGATSWDTPAAGGSGFAPVVDTTGGKLRGVVNRGVFVYRGVPYGASTTGTNRFLPPRKMEPWSGVREDPWRRLHLRLRIVARL